jgi:hypothetical protein
VRLCGQVNGVSDDIHGGVEDGFARLDVFLDALPEGFRKGARASPSPWR